MEIKKPHSDFFKKNSESMITAARQHIKDMLAQLPESNQMLFKRMYSHTNLELPIDEVVDNMPEEKLDWALSQCERTLEKGTSDENII